MRFIDGEKSTGETVSQERRDGAQNDRRIIGHVIQCDGARARIAAYAHSSTPAVRMTVMKTKKADSDLCNRIRAPRAQRPSYAMHRLMGG